MVRTIVAVVIAVISLAIPRIAEAGCRGCGCRGGPGLRLANGRCASWRQSGGNGGGTSSTVALAGGSAGGVVAATGNPFGKNLPEINTEASDAVEDLLKKELYYDAPLLVEDNGKVRTSIDCRYNLDKKNYTCDIENTSIFFNESDKTCSIVVTKYYRDYEEVLIEGHPTLVSTFIPPGGNAMPLSAETNCDEQQISAIGVKDGIRFFIFNIYTNKKDNPKLNCREPSERIWTSGHILKNYELPCKTIRWY